MIGRGKRGGFTLAEVCVVLGIISIVAGIVAVAGVHAKQAGDVRAAKAQVAALHTALAHFYDKRGRAPRDLNGDGIASTMEIVKQLKDWTLLPENFADVDPWGQGFVIVLKRDYDAAPETKRDINFFPLNNYPQGFQIFSGGPDGISSPYPFETEAADDILNALDS